MQFLQPKPLFMLLLLISIALFFGSDSFKENIALVLINKTLNAPIIAATERQQQLALAAQLLGPSTDSVPQSGMIPAILQGLANLRAGETAVAATWLQAAARAAPYPNSQSSIWVSPWMSIENDGSVGVPGNSMLWRIRPDSLHSGTIEANPDGAGVFYCHKEDERNSAAFEWIQPYYLVYHHTIQVEAQIERGTTLIIETLADGMLQRPLTINGTGEWVTETASIAGVNGKLIYLIVTNPSDETSQNKCAAQVTSIQFLIDDTVSNNKPE